MVREPADILAPTSASVLTFILDGVDSARQLEDDGRKSWLV